MVMTAHRTASIAGTASIVGAVAMLLATAALPAAPARGHGATSRPVSRAVACAPDSPKVASAACRAAIAANGGRAFDDWDNVRVADVRGRDRQVIPDGRLCSGGLDDFRGLDLARADWPATTVAPGARFTFRYRQRIPHRGTFRLYVTNDDYRPNRPLNWSQVATKPFLNATDPTMRGDGYEFTGRLPRDRTGRQIILAIWQNSDTPDTYYSCSDVLFAAGKRSTAPRSTGAAKATASDPPESGAGVLGRAAPADAPPAIPAAGSTRAGGVAGGPGLVAAAGGSVAVLAAVAAFALWRRRRRW